MNFAVLQPERLREPVLEEDVREVAAPPECSRQNASKQRGIEGGQHGIGLSLQNPPIMPARVAVVAFLCALASCALASGWDGAVDAQRAESHADRTTGIEHAEDLMRAASAWRKAASGRGVRADETRRRLAHAMVLDERVQDDPAAPAALRAQAKRDEELARTALLRTR